MIRKTIATALLALPVLGFLPNAEASTVQVVTGCWVRQGGTVIDTRNSGTKVRLRVTPGSVRPYSIGYTSITQTSAPVGVTPYPHRASSCRVVGKDMLVRTRDGATYTIRAPRIIL